MCQSLITSLSVTIPPYCAHCAPKSTTFPRNRSWAVIGRVWCGAGGRDCIEWTSSNTSLAINHVHEHLVLSWQGLSLGRLTAVAYPGILFGGGGSGVTTNSVEHRGHRERGSEGSSPPIRGSGGSCNLVEEISFHIVKSL